jgi:16S rRNA (guanine527-N7)-methyltransferase
MIKKILAHALGENGYHFSDSLQTKILQYLELLTRWNNVFNLTAICDPEEMVWLHIIDSLAITPYLQGQRILDVGTGAGLPGVPLALTQPAKKFVLLDSNGKKTRFLTQVKQELKLQNIDIVQARAEAMVFEPPGFDSILSRAFASIPVMLAKTEHLAAANGQFIAMKGLCPTVEIETLPPAFVLEGVYPLTIKGLAATRHAVCIKRK